MTDSPERITTAALSPITDYATQLQEVEAGLVGLLEYCGLPPNILVDTQERHVVFRNAPEVIGLIDPEHRRQSVYFSKFLVAVASGLFDAALSYLWDETIAELRKRVAQYDMSYFYDNAVTNQQKRKQLLSEDDLDKISDSELIQGALGIELISHLGRQNLDHIRFMRNWASAAHPNHNEITGLQLITFAQTCIREVLMLPLSSVVIQIQLLLASIRSTVITGNDTKEIAVFFGQLSKDQVSGLAQGLFGIYTRDNTSSQARQNVRRLVPFLWGRVEESIRVQIGMKYGQFVANNDQVAKNLARDFLGIAGAESYMPNDLRAVEITSAVEDLLEAHRNFNNFHAEPPLARELQRRVGTKGDIPSQAALSYVHGLVEVFLTNGSGVVWNADPIYRALLEQLTSEQALIAVLSFQEDTIAGQLRRELCEERYREILTMMRSHASLKAVSELIDHIEAYTGPIYRLRDDDRFMSRMTPYIRILEGSSS